MLEDTDFIPIIPNDNSSDQSFEEIPETLPLLPIRNTVLFPGIMFPITVGREKSMKLVQDMYTQERFFAVITQKTREADNPEEEDLYQIGTIARVMKVFQMPDNATNVIIQGKKRFRLKKIVTDQPYHTAQIKVIEEVVPKDADKEFRAVIDSLKELSIKIIQLSRNIPPEAAFAIRNIDNASFLINFICSNSDINIENKQKLLEIDELQSRAFILLEHLSNEVQKLELKDNIQSKVRSELNKQQKEFFLNEQMKTIRDELGEDPVSQEIEELKKRAKKKKWKKDVGDIFYKEVKRLERINPASPDYSLQLTYLQTLLELPWNEYTKDSFDLVRAKKILDRDHYGLDQVKDRILEHLAMLKLKGDLKSPIICLLGPPGVGKTSLGKSIARALKRKYIRMSLGGLHDEAEIRGHRKTYIGAMPGRIIQNLRKVKSANPVFVFDEIDKTGNDFRGDPSYALLEVLDPEQNNTFYDNYLEVEFDLSKVLFIATANTLAPIKPALRDRMEIIHVTGYVVEEKVEIARKHLIPKQLKSHGLKPKQISFSKKVIETIIESYTRESGVRELNNKIAKVVRRIAKKIGFDEEYNPRLHVADLEELLGPPEYLKNMYEGNDYIGVVTGLAWTASGGQILFVETSLSRGKGKLTLTGNLGNVMKESAVIALEYLKSNAEQLNIDEQIFESWNVHIHIPEGAIPKDGPSAGITIVTSIASAFTQRKVRQSLAMTGEITLRGKVLPVGGIKEKILAAKRANIKEVALTHENEKDIKQIKDIYLKDLTIHYVNDIMEVLDLALLEPDK